MSKKLLTVTWYSPTVPDLLDADTEYAQWVQEEIESVVLDLVDEVAKEFTVTLEVQ